MVDNPPPPLYEIRETEVYRRWLDSMRDDRAQAKIAARVVRLAAGNPGDIKPVREGVSELRIDYGPGYRVYFARKGSVLLLLLCGGDKRTQSTDIDRAIFLSRSWKQ